jgi:hypothetical protein
MSKQDIVNVCTLAAHLAMRMSANVPAPTGRHDKHIGEYLKPKVFPATAANLAMQLQRLGRRARSNEVRRSEGGDYYREVNGLPAPDCPYSKEAVRIGTLALEILQPFGLHASVGGEPRGFCLFIPGLPGNTLEADGPDSPGFGI